MRAWCECVCSRWESIHDGVVRDNCYRHTEEVEEQLALFGFSTALPLYVGSYWQDVEPERMGKVGARDGKGRGKAGIADDSGRVRGVGGLEEVTRTWGRRARDGWQARAEGGRSGVARAYARQAAIFSSSQGSAALFAAAVPSARAPAACIAFHGTLLLHFQAGYAAVPPCSLAYTGCPVHALSPPSVRPPLPAPR